MSVLILCDWCVTVGEDAVESLADVHANVALESAAVEHVPVGYVQIACVLYQVNNNMFIFKKRRF